ncbi:MAG: dTDP-4-dehydrorhamnose 3,5-epimerase [candidate division WOR-3 bacterium]
MPSIEKTAIEDVLLIKPKIFEDHRGSFVETYNIKEYRKSGINIRFVRDDISTSTQGVLRGIHYDNKTWKLIQCLYGRIYFVVVDLRRWSKTYKKWLSFILSDSNRFQVLVPPNCGNGHLVLSKSCIFSYKQSEYYNPENEKILRWNDPEFNIYWPIKNPILSQKDELGRMVKRR